MGDPDRRGKTIPSDSDSDSDHSALQFASDDEDAPVASTFFVEASAAPSAWDFRAAAQTAKAPEPFQTTIDDKIRTAREKVAANPPPSSSTLRDEEEDVTAKPASNNGHLDAEQSDKKDTHDNSDDSDDDTDSEDNETSKTKRQKASKVKKRQRLERNAHKSPKSFLDLHLSKPLQKAVQVLEWTTPTPIQSRAIPFILAGRDVSASAVTGSGKTAAFLLPILERLLQAGIDNVTRVLILLPTRELAAQCHSVLTSLCRFTAIRAALAVGGLCGESQQVALRARPHVIVATPGRLIDHVRNSRGFALDDIEVLVMDEADRLLDMGFQAEVEEIVRNTPANRRQTLLFSATMTPGLEGLIKLSLQNPVTLAVDAVLDVASTLRQEFIKLKPAVEDKKGSILLALAMRTFKTRTIIFFRQKVTAHRFKILFGLCKLNCSELHGNLTQAQRLAALDDFRNGTVDFLLCTDLAARGLDILGVDTVINYDMPAEMKEYVHRVGRTARAGRAGRACSLVCTGVNDERRLLREIAKRGGDKIAARVVPVAVVGRWAAWIGSVEDAVSDVLKQEREEREMRLAEMEINKANNMMKFSKEIYSRPAKSWFQTEGEKRAEKDRVRKGLGLETSKGDGNRVKSSDGKKRKAEDIEEPKEESLKRSKKRDQRVKEEAYTRQRMDARRQKRSKNSKRKRVGVA